MRPHPHRSSLAVGATIVVTALVAPLLGAVPATAAPAGTSPGPSNRLATDSESARDPKGLFVEDFEHDMAKTPVMLNQYVGADGETYTADPVWIDAAQCNGIVTSADSANMPSCAANRQLRDLASVLGQITDEDPQTNHVVSAWTNGPPMPADSVQIESRDPFSLGAAGRFVSFGVSAAAGSCFASHPLLDFMLIDGDVERPVAERPIDPCTDPRSSDYTASGATYKGGEFVSAGGVLFSGDSLRWRLRNAQPSSGGNDGAIDRVTIVDSTPQIENTFTGSPIVGDTARMTVRIVNTSERGSKPGWSFSERLPTGLTVAAEPALQTTCSDPDNTVASGASSVHITGDLAIDSEDCTVSFDVQAAEAGTYTVGAGDVSDAKGVDLPSDASVTFAPERNELAVSERGVLTGGNGDDIADLGEQIAFATRVENRGNVTVHDLRVTGTAGAVACPVTTLEPGASTECTSPARQVTQDDVDAGGISDSVEARATSRQGQAVSGSADARVPTTDSAAAASLTLTPRAGAAPGVGDAVRLGVTVRNTGNVSVRDVRVVVQDRPELTVTCPTGALAPGASVDCEVSGTHTVTQADVDAGHIEFVGAMSGVAADGAPVRADTSATQETVAPAPAIAPTLSAVVQSDGDSVAPGDTVALTVRVENSGNVTLSDIGGRIADRDGLDIVCPAGPLAPGASVDCTVAGYTLTQTDVDRGTVTFEANVDGTAPSGTVVQGRDTATAPVAGRAAVVATLTATLHDGDRAPRADDHVDLAVVVRNTGTVTLQGLTAGIDGRDLAVTCDDESLAPGAERTCTVEDHVLTQAEVDAGTISFAATAEARTSGGESVTAVDTATVALVRVAAIENTATSVLDANDHEVPLAGDTATLTVTVRNTGNVTVTGIRTAITDLDDLDVRCADDALAPGASTTCAVSSYTLTQADVDRGAVEFTAASAGTGADRQRAEAETTTTLPIVRAGAIRATAEASLTAEGAPRAGDGVDVRIAVVNTGNITVRDLAAAVHDETDQRVTCAPTALAPGERAECTVSRYDLTQGDVDAGVVGFDLVSDAVGADGRPVSDRSRAELELEQRPSADLMVSAHLGASSHTVPVAGDPVDIAVQVRNTGTVTLSDPAVELLELADVPVTCPDTPLAPGAVLDCAVDDLVLSQSDVEHGSVTIAGVLTASAPSGTPVTDRAEVHVVLDAASALDLTAEPLVRDRSGSLVRYRDTVLHPGDEVWVRYGVVNTGNLQVTDLRQAAGTAPLTADATTLAPGARTTATTTRPHVVTAAEAAAGKVVLVGRVTGQVVRADGSTTEAAGAATIGQSDTDRARHGGTAARPWVFSNEIRTVVTAGAAPLELAFTGSEVLVVGLPVAIVALLGGLVLLLVVRRRRDEEHRRRH